MMFQFTVILANAGLPMLAVFIPVFAWAIIPVVLIEGVVFRQAMSTSWNRSFANSMIANIISTVAGVPLSWILLVVAQISIGGGGGFLPVGSRSEMTHVLFGQVAWYPPYPLEVLAWLVPRAMLLLILFFFMISTLIEFIVIRKRQQKLQALVILKGVVIANVTTYGLILGWSVYDMYARA
jgi:hypothetical protein